MGRPPNVGRSDRIEVASRAMKEFTPGRIKEIKVYSIHRKKAMGTIAKERGPS